MLGVNMFAVPAMLGPHCPVVVSSAYVKSATSLPVVVSITPLPLWPTQMSSVVDL
jgi:hypothetical protein